MKVIRPIIRRTRNVTYEKNEKCRQNPEGERMLRRPRPRWADNTKMDITEVGCEVGEWNYLSPGLDQCRNPVDVEIIY
jgi:hypothetical protein